MGDRVAELFQKLGFTIVPAGERGFIRLKPSEGRTSEAAREVGEHDSGVPTVVSADPLVVLDPIFDVNVVSAGEETRLAGLSNDDQRGRRLAGRSHGGRVYMTPAAE